MTSNPTLRVNWSGSTYENDLFYAPGVLPPVKNENNFFGEFDTKDIVPVLERSNDKQACLVQHHALTAHSDASLYSDRQPPPNSGPPQSSGRASHTPRSKPKPSSGHKTKRYYCTYPLCSQTFTCPHNREQHIREKHTFERRHVCAECAAQGIAKAFTRPFTLYRHLREVHKLHVSVGKGNRRKGTAGIVKLQQHSSPLLRRACANAGAVSRKAAKAAARDSEAPYYVNQVQEASYLYYNAVPAAPPSQNRPFHICTICTAFAASTLDALALHQHEVHSIPPSIALPNAVHAFGVPDAEPETWLNTAAMVDTEFETNLKMRLEAFLRG